jgi:F-type H+-transporting ATPase subunit b
VEQLIETFDINLSSLIAQVVNFTILLLILSVFAYKPIMKLLDERSNKIKESLEMAETVKAQAQEAGEETKKRISEAVREGQEIIGRAVKSGEELRQKAQADAVVDGENIITRARAEIKQERDEAIDGVRREFADLTILAAGKVIDRSLDEKTHRELIDEILEKSDTLKKG